MVEFNICFITANSVAKAGPIVANLGSIARIGASTEG